MDDHRSLHVDHDHKATSSDSEPESMDDDTGCDSPWPATHVSDQRLLHATSHARRISVPPALIETHSCDPTYMCSYLDKQNPNGVLSIKGWKRRWFILDSIALTYAKTEHDEPIKAVSLSNIKSAQRTKDAQFEVVTNLFMENRKPRTFILRASSAQAAEAWVGAILSNKAAFKKLLADTGGGPGRPCGGGSCNSSLGEAAMAAAGGGVGGGVEDLSPQLRRARLSSGDAGVGGAGGGGGTPRAYHGHQDSCDSLGGGGGGPGRASPLPRHDSLARNLALLPKKLVSRNKRRFEEDGFSLDLTYITPRVIGMGFPSQGMEGSFRNPVDEVYRFFETRHPDAYWIYNLCPHRERFYSPERFHCRVLNCPFEDHNPPPFEGMRPLCRRMTAFLAEDPAHIAAVHCKAGKGRTGVVVVAFLLHSGHCATAEEALLYYGRQRTVDGKGVTIPSQIRYCHYFAQNLGMSRSLRRLVICRIRVVDPPAGSQTIVAKVTCGGQTRTLIAAPPASPSRGIVATGPLLLAPPSPPGAVDLAPPPARWGAGFDFPTAAGTPTAAAAAAAAARGGLPVVVAGDVGIEVLGGCRDGVGDAAAAGAAAAADGGGGIWKRMAMGTAEGQGLCRLWFHTSFVEGLHLRLARHELDGGPKKDKNHDRFRAGFAIEIFFNELDDAAAAAAAEAAAAAAAVAGIEEGRWWGDDEDTGIVRRLRPGRRSV